MSTTPLDLHTPPEPQFAVKDNVTLLADLSGIEADEAVALVTTTVAARYYLSEVGWLYALTSVHGYYAEKHLTTTTVAEETNAVFSSRVTVSPESLGKVLLDEPARIGDGVRLTDAHAVDARGRPCDAVGLITGKIVSETHVDYVVALMDSKGEFVENPMNLFESHEFEVVDADVLAMAKSAMRPRATLTVVK